MKFIKLLLPLLMTACCSYPVEAAQVKLVDLPALTQDLLQDDDLMMVYDFSAQGSKKISIEELDERWGGGGGGGDVTGPDNAYQGMLATYADGTGKLLKKNQVFFDFNNDETYVFFDREDEDQEKGQDVYVNTGAAQDGSDAVGGKINLNSGDGKGTGDGGQIRLGAGDAPESGTGGHIEIASGDSDTGNAGDVIATPGVSNSNGMGNFVIQNKTLDTWIGLWGDNGITMKGERNITFTDGTYFVSIMPPITMGEDVGVRWFAAGGNEGDVATLGADNQLIFEPAGGGGGPTCATFSPVATYSGNLPWTGRTCVASNQLSVHIEAEATGGGGSGTDLEFDVPTGFTINTSVHPGAGSNKYLTVCRGSYGVTTSLAYDMIAAPKVGDTTKLSVFYRDTSNSATWNPVRNNAPNNQSVGINYVLDCDFTVNE